MHRNKRLTEIVRCIRAERLVSAEQLAERFDVSPRTIYRDVALLNRMGVPVVGEAGIGYHLNAGAQLEAVQFTADELEAMFKSAQKSLAEAEPHTAAAILRVMTKVKDALPDPLIDAFGALAAPNPVPLRQAG